MFFSLIIPVYNVEKYLGECIDSILRQDFSDYELILVDDGSKDSSGKICDSYSEKYDFIKTIHKKNGGQADARNVGANAASGEYIIYLDSDDYIISDLFLSDIYKHIQQKNSDIVMYKFQKYFDDTGVMENCTFSFPQDETLSPDDLLLDVVKRDAYYGMAWTKAFKRSIAVEFDRNLVCEDMDWFFQLLSNSNSFSVVDKSYIAYRQRAGSVTATIKLVTLTDFIFTLEKWSRIFQESEFADAKKKALFGVMAKYYSNLLIVYSRLKDKNKKEYIRQIKKLSYLLDYSLSGRPVTIRKVYKIAGFGFVIKLLQLADKLKG